ncbi:MAG: SRPBCC family protein [Acidimicrobiales bacterium]
MREARDTHTGTVELDVEADVAFAVLADVANIPMWAPAFADAVVPSGGGLDEYEATKAGTTFGLRFVTRADSRTIDFLRPIFPDRDSGASIRVLPGPRTGCLVIVTLPVPPGADSDSVASTLTIELAAIANLVEAPSG